MSIIATLEDGWYISHEDYINELVTDRSLKSQPLFAVLTPFRMDLAAAKLADEMEAGRQTASSRPPRKRKREWLSLPYATEKQKCKRFLEDLRSREVWASAPPTPNVVRDNNRRVRDLVAQLEARSMGALSQVHFADAQDWVIPKDAEPLVQTITNDSILSLGAERKFDVILIDPPWSNKHVRRDRQRGLGYETMTNEAIGSLPLPHLFSEAGTLVLVWCTSAKRHLEAVEEWFRLWQVTNFARWIWLKVTHHGEPVSPLDSHHKNPFEFLYIGYSKTKGSRINVNAGRTRIICSVPSACHSHKPPLTRVIEDAFGPLRTGKCLELFGRYLTPGWVTVGDQCLKFQNLSFFQPLQPAT